MEARKWAEELTSEKRDLLLKLLDLEGNEQLRMRASLKTRFAQDPDPSTTAGAPEIGSLLPIEFDPPPNICDFPTWVRAVHESADVAPATGRFRDRRPVVQTWYLDHARFRSCDDPRALILSPEVDFWASRIRQLWIDKVVPDEGVEFYVATERPFADSSEVLTHVLVVQQPVATEVAVLVSISEPNDPWHPYLRAVIVSSVVTRDALLPVAGQQARCLRDSVLCTVSKGDVELTDGTLPIHALNGNVFTVYISPLLRDKTERVAMLQFPL